MNITNRVFLADTRSDRQGTGRETAEMAIGRTICVSLAGIEGEKRQP